MESKVKSNQLVFKEQNDRRLKEIERAFCDIKEREEELEQLKLQLEGLIIQGRLKERLSRNHSIDNTLNVTNTPKDHTTNRSERNGREGSMDDQCSNDNNMEENSGESINQSFDNQSNFNEIPQTSSSVKHGNDPKNNSTRRRRVSTFIIEAVTADEAADENPNFESLDDEAAERTENPNFDWRDGKFAWIKFTESDSKYCPGFILTLSNGTTLARHITVNATISSRSSVFYKAKEKIDQKLKSRTYKYALETFNKFHRTSFN